MNERIKNALGAIGILLALCVVVYLGFQIRNQYQYPVRSSRTVTMSAEGKVTAKPDTGSLSFSVVTQGRLAEEVQKDNDKKMVKVIEFLKGKGIKEEDIQTSGYNLYPQYNYNVAAGEQPIITGYNLNQQVSAKIRDLDSVKAITGGLTGQGVNQIDNVSFFIDDPDKLKAEARQKAIDKAKEKAQDLAQNLGVRLGKVVNFSEGGFADAMPYPSYAGGYGGGAGGGGYSPVQPGSQDVIVSVNLTFELK